MRTIHNFVFFDSMGFLSNLDIALTWILPCLFIVDGSIKVIPFNIELFGEIVRLFI